VQVLAEDAKALPMEQWRAIAKLLT
jgi:hypothetical protein